MDEQMAEWIKVGWMDTWMDGSVDERMEEWKDDGSWVDWQANRWRDGGVEEWMDDGLGCMNG